MNILRQKTEDVEVKRYAVGCMEATGSFEYCRVVLAELKRRAVAMIEGLDEGLEGGGGGEGVRRILEKMDVV